VIRVRLFAALRESAGSSWVEVEASDVGGVIDGLAARFGPEFERIANAGKAVVDGETVGRDRALAPGEEVALLPPVSGGSG
jgi:MoaD family protein